MHGAVQVHGRNGLMGRQNVPHRRGVIVEGDALIMNHHVIAISPGGVAKNGHRQIRRYPNGVGGIISVKDDVHSDIGPCLNPLKEDLVLGFVIVATTARDKKCLERPVRWSRRCQTDVSGRRLRGASNQPKAAP